MSWLEHLGSQLARVIKRVTQEKAAAAIDDFARYVVDDFNRLPPSKIHDLEDVAVAALEKLSLSPHSRVSPDDIVAIKYRVQGD